jgi:hypothetical protein
MKKLDSCLGVGSRIGQITVLAAVPHSKLPHAWAVVGRRDDGTFGAWVVRFDAGSLALTSLDDGPSLACLADALAAMLRRARVSSASLESPDSELAPTA